MGVQRELTDIYKNTRKVLKKKPLVEAIFEIRWQLQEKSQDVLIDPHFKLLIGRIYDRICNEYPYYEELPPSALPDEMSAHIVQYRFRKGKDLWPLVQLGPGILTLNDTEAYVWDDFHTRIERILDVFYEVYPENGKSVVIDNLMLRYIDSVGFDYTGTHVFDFLRSKLKTDITLPQKLFENTGVNPCPLNLDMMFSFESTEPDGIINLHFGRGKDASGDILLWETVVQGGRVESIHNKDSILTWTDQAHLLAGYWFFKMIEGELQEAFEK